MANEQLGGRRLMDVLRLLAVFQSFSDRFWLAKRRRYAGELSFCVKRQLAKKRRSAVHPTDDVKDLEKDRIAFGEVKEAGEATPI